MENVFNRCDESKISVLGEETLRTAIRGEVEDWRAFLQESEDGFGESEMWRRDVNKKKDYHKAVCASNHRTANFISHATLRQK
jgi:hypothetical protein